VCARVRVCLYKVYTLYIYIYIYTGMMWRLPLVMTIANYWEYQAYRVLDWVARQAEYSNLVGTMHLSRSLVGTCITTYLHGLYIRVPSLLLIVYENVVSGHFSQLHSQKIAASRSFCVIFFYLRSLNSNMTSTYSLQIKMLI